MEGDGFCAGRAGRWDSDSERKALLEYLGCGCWPLPPSLFGFVVRF